MMVCSCFDYFIKKTTINNTTFILQYDKKTTNDSVYFIFNSQLKTS